MNLLPVLILLGSFTSFAKEQKKEFYYMGAGGEPAGKTTIFDSNIKLVGKFVKNSDWKTTVSLNGGHAKTEEILKTNFGKAENLGDFTEANYDKMIADIIRKIESGELAEGDQLMIMVDSHGAKKKAEKTHKIAVKGRSGELNYSNLTGSKTVVLDPLEKVAELAAQKKIKLALIDLSCYSGNLLNIKNQNVCMISSSSPDHPSYASGLDFLSFTISLGFGSSFTKNMKPKTNLEDLFLTALNKTDYYKVPENPMISTPEGKKIYDLLHEKLKTFYYSNSKHISDFSNQYDNHDNLEELICKKEEQYQELKSLIAQVSKISADNTFEKLNQKLENYREYQRQYERLLLPMEKLDYKLKNFARDHFPNTLTLAYDFHVIDYLLNDPNKVLGEVRNDPFFKNLIGRMEDSAKLYNAFKASMTKEELRAYQKVLSVRENKKKTYSLAGDVSDEVKKLYTKLYKEFQTEKSNPCRDFTL